jgi:hypothetical protein
MSLYAVNGKEPIAAWIPSRDDAGNGTTTLNDLVGTNHGTLTNMDPATDWVVDTGAGGIRALDFDGVNDHVNCGNIAINNVSQIAYSVWVKPRVFASFAGILGKYASTTSDTELLAASSSLIQTVRNGADSQFRSTGSVLTLNAWIHLVIVFDGTQAIQANRMQIYANGNLVPQTNSNSLPATTANNVANFFIGRYPGPAGTTIDARIDDVRIFDQALTATDIADLYAAQRGGITGGGIPQTRRRRELSGAGL